MGNVPLCGSKQNQLRPKNNTAPKDLNQLIPEMLRISPQEFKRIYKQSKKTKNTITKRLHSKSLLNKEVETIPVDSTKLIELPEERTNNSFIISLKSLINSASILSLVILKDIIFQIESIPDHVRRYMHQYNKMYELQLKQRCVDVEELILAHYGLINDLYHTIYMLLYIGFTKLHNTNYLVLLYEDLSFLDLIKFYIALKEKLRLGEDDYEQYKLQDKRYILYERLSEDNDIKISNIYVNRNSYQHTATNNYIFLLVSGYLFRGRAPIDIIELCIKFYLIPNDTNYSHLFSVAPQQFPCYNRLKIDIFNFETLSKHSLNIEGLNSDGTHCMYLVRNIGLPKWIHKDIVNLGVSESIYDDKYFKVMNSNNLCVLYDQITYSTYNNNNNNNNKQTMIVFDPYHIEYGGYAIQFAKSFALNLYLWNKTTDRKTYHRNRNSIICLNRIGNKSTLSEYNINENKYNILDGILHVDRCEGAGMCLFDNETKLLLSGGRAPCIHYKYKCKCKTFKSNEIYIMGAAGEYNYFGYVPIADMNLPRLNHGMLYNKELQRVIVGGGQDLVGGQYQYKYDNEYNSKEINSYFNKYKYLTPHTIEIFDLNKNKWNLIDVKTNNGYALNPVIWYNNNNPFIINIFNAYLSYSGKRANHSEFLDIRQQKKWMQNTNINNYVKENHTSHISMY